MPSEILLPTGLAPSNLHLRPTVTAQYVEGDIFDIANRVKAIDANLHVVQLTEDDEHAYAIMEHCNDGVERLVFSVPVLDARVLDRLRYLMAVPVTERVAALEADERRSEAQREQDDLDELYDRLGGPVRHEMARCGFTAPLPASYPMRNRTAMRHRRGRH
jgi:hypothetical protein